MLNVNKKQQTRPAVTSYLSKSLKLWLVAAMFYATFLYLYDLMSFPGSNKIPEELVLGMILVMLGYIWFQELRDRRSLESLTEALINSQERLKRGQIDTIAALILAEEAKDHYMQGHSNRVAKYCLAIAREMGFEKEREEIMRRSGMLHDIGKIGIVDDILKKFDKLSAKEKEILKKHPRKAREILKPLEFLSKEKDIIAHHHERYDGGGYPDGLKAGEIPLEARILAVADTFDAMNSERSYRKPLSKEEIIAELKKVSGSQLDPSVVGLFLSLLEKNPDLWKMD